LLGPKKGSIKKKKFALYFEDIYLILRSMFFFKLYPIGATKFKKKRLPSSDCVATVARF
jgi:hypothetical protein